MADDMLLKLQSDDDIMKFINVEDDINSDLELSEDGVSSVASSTELKFGTPDNYEYNGVDFDYNWLPVPNDNASGKVEDGAPFGDRRLSAPLQPEEQLMHHRRVSHGNMPVPPHQEPQTMGGYVGHGVSPHAQDLIQRVKFGAYDNPDYPFTPPSMDTTLFNVSEKEAAALPYTLILDDFPPRSRVETQIKCKLSFRRKGSNDLPSESLLHLPSDTIARPRFQLMSVDQLTSDEALKSQTLWLSVEAINLDAPEEQVLMCAKCLARERRRAFRKKAMDPHEETYWNGLQARRIIIFNCREVVPINTNGQVELPLRIACYCRHHAAKSGYQLVFALRNSNGDLLARTLSSKVFITDSHKDQKRVGSAQNLVSPGISTPATPSSVGSSQDSISSTHMRRASSASSLGMAQAQAQHVQQQQLQSHAIGSAPQYPQVHQHQHHPYMRPAKPSASSSSHASNIGGPGTAAQGFQALPSSHLSRQIQKLHAVPSWLAGVQMNDTSQTGGVHMNGQPQIQQQHPQQHQAVPPQAHQHHQGHHDVSGPTIFKVIPQSGSVRGGIEVTILGQNLRPGMVAMFGESQSINTQCWSDNTMIAQLPPSSQPGPVPVTFLGEHVPASPPLFTYVNDGEDKLKEIALQMVGYKVTGKIEDAADIAQRIIMNDSQRGQNGGGTGSGNGSGGTSGAPTTMYSTDKSVSADSAEQIALWVLHNLNKISTDRVANFNLRNSEGQGMIHLASMLGYASVVKALIANGAYVDIQDVSGYTPLQFAVLCGNRNITRLLLMADADPFHRTLNGLTALDLTDATVEDLLPKDQRAWFSELNRRGSSSSVASMIHEWHRETSRPPLPTPQHSASPVEEGEGDADDESEDSPRKPPSYSQLFPAEGSKLGSRSSKRHSNTMNYGLTNAGRKRSNTSVPVIDIEVLHSGDEEEEEESDEEVMKVEIGVEGNDEEDADVDDGTESRSGGERQVLWKFNVKNEEIWNDRMLFTFWIPLALVTVLGISAIYIIQSYGASDAHPLAIKIGDKVADLFSGAMDRVLPMPRNLQAPAYAAARLQ